MTLEKNEGRVGLRSVSLNHSHLLNDLAHLDWIDDLLSVQLDLFDCRHSSGMDCKFPCNSA